MVTGIALSRLWSMTATCASQLAVFLVVAAASASRIHAQCPDGTPPPCAGGRAARPVMRITDVPGASSRVTVTYAGTPLNYVFADFERAARRSIVRSLAVDTLRISVRFLDQPWDSAFASVLQAMALLSFELPTGALAVRTGAEDARLVDTEPIVSVTLQVPFTRAREVEQLVAPLLSRRGRLTADSVTNSIVVSDAISRIPRLRALAESLNRP